MKITRILLSATVLVTMLLSSCQQKAADQKTAEVSEDEFRQKLENINPGLEDPSLVMATFEMVGAEYIAGLVVPMEHVDYYAQDPAQAALTLGVYMVDIAYLVSYGKNEQALIKYERARKLADAIGLVSSFEAAVFERYAKVSADPDSLKKNLTMTARNIDREMSQGERARHVVLFVTGEFVEKMYLLTQVIDQYPDDFPEDVRSQLLRHMMIGLVEQEEPLNDLIDLLNQIREEDEGEEFMAEMNALKDIYVEANFKEMIANWTPQSTGSGEYLDRITERVARIRERIVSTDR